MAVQHVTQMGSRRRSPHSHVLPKLVGNTLSASWPVTNTGELTGSGVLIIQIFIPGGPNVGFVGSTMSVPAGATVTMNVTGVLASPLVAGQTYQGQLRLTPIAPATVGPSSTHDFSVTLPRFADGARVSGPGGVGTVIFSTLRLRDGVYFFEVLVSWDSGALNAVRESQLTPISGF